MGNGSGSKMVTRAVEKTVSEMLDSIQKVVKLTRGVCQMILQLPHGTCGTHAVWCPRTASNVLPLSRHVTHAIRSRSAENPAHFPTSVASRPD